MANEQVPAYVALLKCGCVVGACVDDGEDPESVKEFLVEAAKAGNVIERKTVGWVRENFRKCNDHEKSGPAQLNLLEE
jgi:hypothetical protein